MTLETNFVGFAQVILNTSTTDLYALLLSLIALLFFFAWFYGIIKDFTMFSSGVSLIIALALTLTLGFTGGLHSITLFLINKTGHIITLVIYVAFFSSSYFIEHATMKAIRKKKLEQKKIEEYKEKAVIKSFFRLLGRR